MPSLPDRRPKQLSLGPLEQEILSIVWELGSVSVRDVHEHILTDPDRELAYTSVSTILNRLTKKGWLSCNKTNRSFHWQALFTEVEARSLQAHAKLQEFLAIGNPDVVAAFADSLDAASVEKMSAIARRLADARKQREGQN